MTDISRLIPPITTKILLDNGQTNPEYWRYWYQTGKLLSGAAGGDLGSTYPNPSVVKINGVALGTTTATSGNILIANGSQWNTTAISGDATIVSSGALTLANTAVTPASYTVNGKALFTVDSKGRLTSASNATIAASDITGVALSKADDTNVTLTLTGTPTTALLAATTITAGWSGQLGLTRGGTAASLTASNGGIVYSTASAMAILAGTATASKMLLSGASTTPTWSTSTIPTSAGATANKVLLSDGTNYVLSTPTFPNASATSGKNIQSDGTNWVASTSTWPTTGTQGGVVYCDASNSFSQLAKDTNSTRYLSNTGTSNNPAWSQVDLSNGVTGTLPIANGGTGVTVSNPVIQRVSTETGAVSSGSTTIPFDDTIPQKTEGDQVMTLSVTPKSTTNILQIDMSFQWSNSSANLSCIGALFQDTTSNALAACMYTQGVAGSLNTSTFTHTMTAGTTSSTTFKLRIGGNGGTLTFNGQSAVRLLGGVLASTIIITEYAA